jgi:4-diphosphocytidyl-2-C-methyl-D-erythritol kinase
MKAWQGKTPAKINLFLRVLGRRSNGYHDIRTLMVPIALFDTIRIKPSRTGLTLRCPGHPELDGQSNLAFRAAEAWFQKMGLPSTLRISIQKKIPIQAGLGGGSSDAAAVLRWLQKNQRDPLSKPQLLDLAVRLGADIPFFLDPKPSLATGIGEHLQPVKNLPEFWVLLACPPYGLSTSLVYRSLKFPLTQRPDNDRGWHSGNGFSFERLVSCMVNDLQPIGEKLRPAIGRVCREMTLLGAAGVAMSGSGPTVFGVFNARQAAIRCRRSLKKQKGWMYLVKRGMTEAVGATT